MRTLPSVGKVRASVRDDVSDEVGEAIDGLGHADERVLALLVEAAHPVGEGLLGEEKAPRGLGDGPPARGAEGEDGEPGGRRVVRASRRRDVLEASPQDASLLLERGDLGERDVALGDEADASDAAVEAPSADVGGDEVREREGVQRGGARVRGPRAWQRHVAYRARRPS